MIRLRFALLALMVLGILPFVVGCEDDVEPVKLPGEVTIQNAYVGAPACRTCHQSQYALFAASGHAHALNAVVGGRPPVYPYSAVTEVPAGKTWGDILAVVGGYGWKANYLDQQGYLITGDAAQWNLETNALVPFDAAATNRPFDSGRCHATGYAEAGHQGGLPGIVGTWQDDGVTCERCHGAGGAHVLSRLESDIHLDRSSELCGACHSRGDATNRVAAADGFILQYSQYDELRSGPHKTLTCVACHDPHASAVYAQAGKSVGLTCTECHADIEIFNTGDGAHTCVNCHMAYAGKSAVARSANRGDLRSHLFRINAAADAEQFYTQDGRTFSNGYLTTSFACLSCHTGRDRAWAAQFAPTIHSAGHLNRAAGR